MLRNGRVLNSSRRPTGAAVGFRRKAAQSRH